MKGPERKIDIESDEEPREAIPVFPSRSNRFPVIRNAYD